MVKRAKGASSSSGGDPTEDEVAEVFKRLFFHIQETPDAPFDCPPWFDYDDGVNFLAYARQFLRAIGGQ